MNITPTNAVQAASPAGKSADSDAPDVPFSQVLSGEIAQSRKNDAAKESSDANAKPDPASRPAGTAEGKTDSAQQARPGGKAAHDKDETIPAEDAAAVAPETLLALAINPDAFKPTAAPAGTRLTPTEPMSATPGAAAVPVLDTRNGRMIPVAPAVGPAGDKQGAQAAQRAGNDHGQPAIRQAGDDHGQPVIRQAGDDHVTQKIDPRLSGKEDMPAVAARTAAPADSATFQGQLAVARNADAAKTGEVLSDLVGTAAMRVAPHIPVDAGFSAADVSAPRLAPTVGTTAWGQALGDKLVWMAAGTQQTASLTLNPPNLGPLQIVLNVTHDQATASFFSAQPEVRQALEAAFPRLREMMNDAGIQLGQATVSADTPQQRNDTPDRQAQRIAPPFPGTDAGSPPGLQAIQAPIRQSGRGLVDTFA
ncbi:MAG: flagellar hook-length control protein FliK [Hydrogenophilales bacterium]|nr:flagellar hook-length control protein FliK [Hydrogenophilales bacterium]